MTPKSQMVFLFFYIFISLFQNFKILEKGLLVDVYHFYDLLF